eukprot:1342462-Rhodomonas_salina.2
MAPFFVSLLFAHNPYTTPILISSAMQYPVSTFYHVACALDRIAESLLIDNDWWRLQQTLRHFQLVLVAAAASYDPSFTIVALFYNAFAVYRLWKHPPTTAADDATWTFLSIGIFGCALCPLLVHQQWMSAFLVFAVCSLWNGTAIYSHKITLWRHAIENALQALLVYAATNASISIAMQHKHTTTSAAA